MQDSPDEPTPPAETAPVEAEPPPAEPVSVEVQVPPAQASWTIAFSSDRDGDQEIYLMQGDGSGLVQLTHNKADDYEATWSPDGSQLAFTRRRAGIEQIFIM